jgi:hypothetical protein
VVLARIHDHQWPVAHVSGREQTISRVPHFSCFSRSGAFSLQLPSPLFDTFFITVGRYALSRAYAFGDAGPVKLNKGQVLKMKVRTPAA